jgi:hypothetical protein
MIPFTATVAMIVCMGEPEMTLFQVGQDQIDLAIIDANANLGGNQALT